MAQLTSQAEQLAQLTSQAEQPAGLTSQAEQLAQLTSQAEQPADLLGDAISKFISRRWGSVDGRNNRENEFRDCQQGAFRIYFTDELLRL